MVLRPRRIFSLNSCENDEIFYTVFGKIIAMDNSHRKKDKLSDIMSASANEVFGRDGVMVTAESKKVKTEDIFVDRRKELVDRREITGGIGYFNCRRQLKDRRRNKYVYDIREWWLRVNYVEVDQ
jgi:hypothetical protein